MSEERMSAKQYAKFEKAFYLFGSLAKMVNPVRPDEWKQLAEEMWTWAIVKVAALVDESTSGFLEPPPRWQQDLGSPSDVADYDDRPEVLNPNARLIRVKEKAVLKSGKRDNRHWTLTKIVAVDGGEYSTFAGSRYEVGKEYAIEVESVTRGENTYLQIKEPK
jgi:hypothetical protein